LRRRRGRGRGEGWGGKWRGGDVSALSGRLLSGCVGGGARGRNLNIAHQGLRCIHVRVRRIDLRAPRGENDGSVRQRHESGGKVESSACCPHNHSAAAGGNTVATIGRKEHRHRHGCPHPRRERCALRGEGSRILCSGATASSAKPWARGVPREEVHFDAEGGALTPPAAEEDGWQRGARPAGQAIDIEPNNAPQPRRLRPRIQRHEVEGEGVVARHSN
jgi:hypothetical protein